MEMQGNTRCERTMRQKAGRPARLAIFLALLLIACIGCQKDPQEEARSKLTGELGVRWSKETFIEAAQNGDTAVVQLFLTGGMNPDVTGDEGKTALIWAAENGHADTVKTLLDNYADPNAIDRQGRTALIWAAEGDHISCVQALVAKHADVNAKALDGSTALGVAKKKGYTEIAKLLELAGAK